MQVTVTQIKTSQWKPVTEIVTVFNEEEFNILRNKLPALVRDCVALKNNTYEHNRSVHYPTEYTIEDARAHHIRVMCNILGIKA